MNFNAVADVIDRKNKLHRVMVGEAFGKIVPSDHPAQCRISRDRVFVAFGDMPDFPGGVYELVEANLDEVKATVGVPESKIAREFEEIVTYLEGDGFNQAPEITSIALELDSGLAADLGLVKASVKAFMLRTLNHLRTQVLSNGAATTEDDS